MRGNTYLPSVVASIAAALLGTSFPSAAEDAAYCVTCTGPDQTYICRVTGDQMRRTDALKLFCIVRTAKEGGHASCGAKNDIAGCQGIPKVYAYDGPSLPVTVSQRPPAMEGESAEETFDSEPREGAPKTLVEATGRAYSASRRGIRNVRARLGRGEGEEQAALQGAGAADSLPVDAAPHGTLPELPGGSPSPLAPLPEGLTPEAEAALAPQAAVSEPEDESSGRIRRGAQNVGKFAKKSYRCVRSLFFKCRGQPQALDAR